MLNEKMNPPAIAEVLGISRQRAWKLAREALEELKESTLDKTASWRDFLTAESLEQLYTAKLLRDGTPKMQALEDAMPNPDGIAAVFTALDKLRGLYVPALPTTTKQELTGAAGGPLQTVSAGLDLSLLSTEQLQVLISTMQQAGAGAGRGGPA